MMTERLTLAESLRRGANLPGCPNQLAQLEAADAIEKIEEIKSRLSELEDRVMMAESRLP